MCSRFLRGCAIHKSFILALSFPFKHHRCFQVYLFHSTCLKKMFCILFLCGQDNRLWARFPADSFGQNQTTITLTRRKLPIAAFRTKHGWSESNGYVVNRLKPDDPHLVRWSGCDEPSLTDNHTLSNMHGREEFFV